jgi:hypothetical protein
MDQAITANYMRWRVGLEYPTPPSEVPDKTGVLDALCHIWDSQAC